MEFFFGESLAELCEECSDYIIIIKEEEEERKFTSMVKGRWGKLEGCVKEGQGLLRKMHQEPSLSARSEYDLSKDFTSYGCPSLCLLRNILKCFKTYFNGGLLSKK